MALIFKGTGTQKKVMYDPTKGDLKSDIEQLRMLVNAQLARTEKIGNKSRFYSIKNMAYKVAVDDIERMTKKKSLYPRFQGFKEATQEEIDKINKQHISNEAKQKRIENKHYFENIALLNSMMTYFNAESYSQARVKILFENRVNTLNRLYNTRFTWQTFQDMTQQAVFDSTFKRYKSKQFFEIVGLFQKHGYELVKALNDSYGKSQRIHKYSKNFKEDDIINYLSQRPVFELVHLETVARTL